MSTIPEQRRILIVDDERPLRDLVAGYLRREGYDVLAAADGPTASRSAGGCASSPTPTC
jgi:DNA-binding response OmpR family regulator